MAKFKFKVGDRVKCVDDKKVVHSVPVAVGNIYTVREVFPSRRTLKVDELEGWWNEERFVLCEEDESKHHKHHDLIVAWAKGAKIQERDVGACPYWEDVEHPRWYHDAEYRIKPEPKPNIVQYFQVTTGAYARQAFPDKCTNVKCVFDGETGKLKAVEIVK